MYDYCDVVVDVWGDFAMFTESFAKVERETYKVPTPSACRGILNAIYSKPEEFYYEITKIEVMKPFGEVLSIKKNEVKYTADRSKISSPNYFIDTSDNTQRMSSYLRDVYYRIHARLVRQDSARDDVNVVRLRDQFNRRVEKGKCFYQPCLGTRECMCYFAPPDYDRKPIDLTCRLGVMLYDIFDIDNKLPLDTRPYSIKHGLTCDVVLRYFDAVMRDGVISVPLYGSDDFFYKRKELSDAETDM